MNKTKISRVQLIESHAVPPSTTMNPVTSDARSKDDGVSAAVMCSAIDVDVGEQPLGGRGWGSGEVT